MINWKNSIHSEVNEDYMSNPSPSLGDTVKISFKAFRESPINSAELRVVICGHSERIGMNISRSDSLFHWWTGELKITQTEMIHWHFLLHCKEGELFYTRSAVETVNPTEDYDFTLLPGFKRPEWVNKAVFYQIFPDRFNNGACECRALEINV